MKESRALRSSLVLLGCGRAVTLVCTLLTVGIMARYLGTAGYGQYRIIIAFLTLSTVLANLGTPLIISREIAKRERDQACVLGNALGLRVVSVAIATAIAGLLALALPLPPIVPIGIAVGAAGFAAVGAHSVLVALFQQRLRQTGAVLAEIAGALALLGLTAWMAAHREPNVLALVVATTIGSIVTVLVSTTFAERLLRFRPKFQFAEWKGLLVPAAPIAVINILTLVYYRFDTIVLSILQPSAAVGLYGVASKILDALMGFTLLFSGLLMPLMSRHASTDMDRFRHYFDTGVDALIIAFTGVLLVIVVYAKEIISIVAGPSFASGAPALQVLGVVALVNSVKYMAHQAVTAVDGQRELVKGYLTASVVGLLAYFSLIPLFAGTGAAIGLLIGECMVFAWTMRILFRRGIRMTAGVPVKVLISFVATAALLESLKATVVPWYVAALLGEGLYLLILLVLRGIPRHVWALVHVAQGRDWELDSADGRPVQQHVAARTGPD